MNKYLLIWALTISSAGITMAQEHDSTTAKYYNVVYLPKCFKEKGVIFNKEYVVGIEMKNVQKRYTPSLEDIQKAEETLVKEYNRLQKTNVSARDYFWRYVRQYVGVVANNGNKNIIVQLINNKNPGKINRLLGKNWENDFVIMLADSFYAVSTRFRIDIDTGTMTDEL